MPGVQKQQSKLQKKLDYLRNNPDLVYQPSKPIIPVLCELEGPEASEHCRYCKYGCYKCEEDWILDGGWHTGICQQPSGPESIPAPKGYWLQYTLHAAQRMIERGISKRAIEFFFQNHCQSDTIEVKFVCYREKKRTVVRVITVYRPDTKLSDLLDMYRPKTNKCSCILCELYV